MVVILGVAVAVAAGLVAVPLVDGKSLMSYTADDSFISFRYSENFANGDGPVWNLAGPRTDGYTSVLWMLLIAIPATVGADPVIVAKVFGALAGGAILAILAFAGGRGGLLARIVAIAALVASPAFLTLTVQGLETTVGALMATLAAWLLFRAVQSPGDRELAAFSGACLLAVFVRPDLAVFAGLCVLGLVIWLIRRDRATLRRALAWIGGVLLLPGALWALWRWSYYGYPLPNTAYAKKSDALIDAEARDFVRTFVTEFALPYVIAIAILAVRAFSRRRRPIEAADWAIGVALVAAVTFLAAGLFFSPIQGNLWRFQMPVFPVLLLCGVLLASRDDLVSQLGMTGSRATRVLAWGVAAAVVLFPLTTIGETRVEVRGRWPHDRIQAGKALAPFEEDGMTMFVSESGAIPLYSKWRAYDLLGLNDHDIAVDGVTVERIRALNPAVLQFVVNRPPQGVGPPVFRPVLSTGRYEFAIATVKTNDELRAGYPPQAHFYFVDTAAPLAPQLLDALRGMRDVKPLPPAVTRQALAKMDYRAPTRRQAARLRTTRGTAAARHQPRDVS
jgi:hypothetical protein